jgi:uncharacterized protein (TIGR04255 family)
MNAASESDSRQTVVGAPLGPAVPRHLEHAPITEALIDFRVQLPEGFSIEKFEPVVSRFAQEYPGKGAIKAFHATVGIGETSSRPDVAHGEIGILIRAADEKTLAQFRIDGFTFNRLEPYTSWEEIFPETIRLWTEFVEAAKPIAVTRLAARYINRLRLPLPMVDLREYLTEPPRIPTGLPQTLRTYLTRLVVHDSIRNHSAIVTQSFEPNPTDTEKAIVLLDIDAFKDVHVRSSEVDEIHRVLAGLHDFKNEIFFRSITQRASELFE